MAYLIVSLVYVASRAWLHQARLPFGFELDWMWLADPADLSHRLAETLWYFHAFPPGMDLLTGLLLKAGGDHAAGLARAVFWCLGLLFANAMVALGHAAGLRRSTSAVVSAAFLLSPPTLYFEHLYLYEWPVMTLLALAAVSFHRACLRPSFSRWACFFVTSAAIGVTRSTFHLVWWIPVVAGAAVVSGSGRRRAALLGALPGLLLVLAVYGKNAILFGEFAASTFGPASLHLITVDRMPREVRDRWIAEGRLSPFAAISPYAPPRDYVTLFASSDLPGWPPQVTRLERVTVPAPNFNHWFILVGQRARRDDVAAYLRAYPFDYVRNVSAGVIAMMGPSTEWHPRTGSPTSPHAGHRQLLGRYESAYNTVVHRLMLAPVGVYVLLPLVLIQAVRIALAAWRRADAPGRTQSAILLFCTFQVLFVIAVSSAATFLESARYRFQVEPFIWILTTVALVSLLPYGRLPDRRHV